MFNKLLKDESDRLLFQYIDEFKRILSYQDITVDEFLKDIEIDIEAHESYDYHTVLINSHYNIPMLTYEEETPNYRAYYKDFYAAVKSAFVAELKIIYDEYMESLQESEEDLDYFANRHYVSDKTSEDMNEVTEEERISLINSYKKEISLLQERMATIKKALQ